MSLFKIDKITVSKKISCIYIETPSKIYAMDLIKDKIEDSFGKIFTYDVEKIKKMARKEKMFFSYSLSNNGKKLMIELKKKGSTLPIINIDIISDSPYMENEEKKERKRGEKEIEKNFRRKDMLREDDDYRLYASIVDLVDYAINPEVWVYGELENSVYVKIWASRFDHFDLWKKIKEIYT